MPFSPEASKCMLGRWLLLPFDPNLGAIASEPTVIWSEVVTEADTVIKTERE